MNLLEIETKYEILEDEFIELNGRKLYRIKALKNFCHIEKGEVGGYIESEQNLSQKGGDFGGQRHGGGGLFVGFGNQVGELVVGHGCSFQAACAAV